MRAAAAELEARFARNLLLFQEVAPSHAERHAGWQPQRRQLRWHPDFGVTVVDMASGGPLYPGPAEALAREQARHFLAEPRVLGSTFETQAIPYEDESLHPRLINRAVSLLDEGTRRAEPGAPEGIHLLIVLGLGIGHHLPELLRHTRVEHLCLVEPDPDLFHAALHTVEWLEVLQAMSGPGRSLEVVAGLDAEESTQRILAWGRDIGGFHFVRAHLYQHLNSEALDEIAHGVRNVVVPQLKGLLGFYDDERIGLAHAAAHLETGRATLGPAPAGAGRGEPPTAIVVANGPSLDDAIDVVRRNRERALIVSCGTALGSLTRAGIQPHIHIEMERLRTVVEWVAEATTVEAREEMLLLGMNTLHPDVFGLFPRHAVLLRPNDLGASWIQERAVQGGALPAVARSNPTVGNMGLAVAAELGVRDIVLVGMDLGYPAGADHHSKLSLHYEMAGEDHEELGIPAVDDPGHASAPGNFGGEVRTTPLYVEAARMVGWLVRETPGLRIRNTARGLRIPGTEPTPVDEVEFTDGATAPGVWVEAHVAPRIRTLTKGGGGTSRRALIAALEALARDAAALARAEAGSRTEAFACLQALHDRVGAPAETTAEGLAQAMLRGSVSHFSLILAQALHQGPGEADAVALFDEVRGCLVDFLEGVADEAAGDGFWRFDESGWGLAERIQRGGAGGGGAGN
jgi:hypothetical protein